MPGRTLALLTALLAGLLTVSPASAAPRSLRTAECQGDWLPATPTSSDVMDGRLSFLDLPAVKVGEKVNWRMDPYHNRSWQMVFQSLRWMGRLVADYESTGSQGYLNRAIDIAKQWVAANPPGGGAKYAWADHPVALRAPALICLSMHTSGAWLTNSLKAHAKRLADPRHYDLGHNHGLDQDIGLLRIACRYGNGTWRKLAVSRMVKSMKLDIDGQGALREQSPRYAIYVYDKLKVAIDTIQDCGVKVPSELDRRWHKLPEHISAATMPNGYMVPLGDGAANVQPTAFPHANAKVQVFDAGYVFGRSKWGDPQSAYYSIRFGPARKFHGHEDHLGVTYYAQGRNVLTEAGFVSYEGTPYRRWTMGPEAHNIPVVVGRAFHGKTASKLVRRSIGKDRQSFTLTDTAYGVRRTRSVVVSHGEDLMAVLDRPGSGKIRNLWHFDPALKVVSNNGGTIVVADGTWRASLVQLNTSTCAPISGQRVVTGKTRPYQGWISEAYGQRTPAPAVLSPSAPGLLTIVVPGTDNPGVTCSGRTVIVHTPTGPVHLELSGSDLL